MKCSQHIQSGQGRQDRIVPENSYVFGLVKLRDARISSIQASASSSPRPANRCSPSLMSRRRSSALRQTPSSGPRHRIAMDNPSFGSYPHILNCSVIHGVKRRTYLFQGWQPAQQDETTFPIAADFLTEILGCIAAILCIKLIKFVATVGG